jgi:uncharacterized protein (TIGR03083 family)
MAQLEVASATTKTWLIQLIHEVGAEAWDTPVPASPQWTVRDVVAHLTGLASTGADGTFPSDLNLLEQFRDDDVVAARNTFADGQVERRLMTSPVDVVAEWDAIEPILLDRIRGDVTGVDPLPSGFDAVLVADICVHGDDVASALGRTPDRTSPASGIAFATYAFGVDYRLRVLGLPALTFRYGGKERTVGDGPPHATVSADRWELLRVVAGRRSRSQIEALAWTGDPDPYLGLLPAYGERPDDLVES